ncbi:glycoside hydrolase family 3 protein [Pseudokordiimonas caeni]|uniref:glycoside hydrolase family 3 protein n=1 Tax=Pseudokordiimonas caeni TaxID=2997908 RepID=UPI002810B501|nr:glycoside hydrolase family 3 N-terminal domain-containing protein [Pseudokordiimonas caeni]
MRRLFTLPILAAALGLAACDWQPVGPEKLPEDKSVPGASQFGARGAPMPPMLHPDIWPAPVARPADSPAIERAVNAAVARMSTDAKLAQMLQVDMRHIVPDDLRQVPFGMIRAQAGSYPEGDRNAGIVDWLSLADDFYAAATDPAGRGGRVPAFWCLEMAHGHTALKGGTIFPHNIGLGAAGEATLVRRVAMAVAAETGASGPDCVISPRLNVVEDDRSGRVYESFSEAPEIAARLGGAYVTGLQGKPGSGDFLRGPRVVSAPRTFLGDGLAGGGQERGNISLDEHGLIDRDGVSFASGVGSGAQMLLASPARWQGIPLHGFAPLLTGVLRQGLGFDGILLGDWDAIAEVPNCMADDCVTAINAGIDMLAAGENWRRLYANMRTAFAEGRLTEARVDEAVRRILTVKARAGLLAGAKPSARNGADPALVGAPAHRVLAREAARKSLVLLKNNRAVLPVRAGARVLVAGEGANNPRMQTGGWTRTWQGTDTSRADLPGVNTIWEGIRTAVEAAGGTATLSEDGNAAGKFDVAILVYGEEPYAEFQGEIDTLDYSPGDDHILNLLARLRQRGIATVSVFLSGRPLWVNPEINASDAFVAAWLPGQEGAGIADVIVAGPNSRIRHDFRGKLTFSWPKRADQYRLNRFDADYDPLFPVGYGLSYQERRAVPQLDEGVGAASGTGTRGVFFAARPTYPYILDLIAADGTRTPFIGDWVASRDGSISARVTNREEEGDGDALGIVFSGQAPTTIALASATPVDLSRELAAGYAMAFEWRVDNIPFGKVEVGLGCGAGCSGLVDISSFFLEAPTGEWQRTLVPLACFAEKGADLSRFTAPLMLTTSGDFALSLADVRLVKPDAGATLECP